MGLTAIDHLDVWVEAQSESSGRGRGATRRARNVGLIQLRKLILDLAITGKLCPNNQEMNSIQSLVENDLQQQIGKKYKFRKLSEKEQFQSIPESWTWTDIRSIGYPLKQKKPDRRFTYIDVGSIESGSGKIIEPSLLEASEAPSRARKIVKNGTVIYSTVRPYLNNVAVIENDFDEEPIASTAFAVVHPSKHVNSQYIYYYLLSPTFVQYVESVQAGIAYPSINNKQFYGAPFPLAPLEEQKRIVAKVDELMGLIDDLEAQTETARESHAELVDALLRSLVESEDANALTLNWATLSPHFDTLFTTEESVEKLKVCILDLAASGRLSFGRSYKFQEYRLEDLIDKMDSGWSPACHAYPVSNDEVWGVLKTTCVQNLRFHQHENKELPQKLKPRPKAETKKGDILFTRAGPFNRVGIACHVKGVRPRLMISDKIIRMRPIKDLVLGDYLTLTLMHGDGKIYLTKCKSGMAKSQVNISQTKLKMTPILVPELDKQKHIVRKVDHLMTFCDELIANIRTSEALKVELAESVVHYASAV